MTSVHGLVRGYGSERILMLRLRPGSFSTDTGLDEAGSQSRGAERIRLLFADARTRVQLPLNSCGRVVTMVWTLSTAITRATSQPPTVIQSGCW